MDRGATTSRLDYKMKSLSILVAVASLILSGCYSWNVGGKGGCEDQSTAVKYIDEYFRREFPASYANHRQAAVVDLPARNAWVVSYFGPIQYDAVFLVDKATCKVRIIFGNFVDPNYKPYEK